MSLRKRIVERFTEQVEKQPNPWVPYQGDAGGEGWQNQITGEIRYQDARPGAEEGVPEDADPSDAPQPEEEVPETIEPEGYPVEDIDVGDEVLAEIDGEHVEGRVFETEEGQVAFRDSDGSAHIVDSEELLGEHPGEEPEMGWAEGWQSAPDDWDELETGMTVEVYVPDSGEYMETEIGYIDDFDGVNMITVHDEEGTPIEIFEEPHPDYKTQALLTATEDPEWVEGVPEGFEQIEPGDLADVDPGDPVALSIDKDDIFPDDVYVGELIDDRRVQIQVTPDDSRQVNLANESHLEDIEGLWAESPELVEPPEVPGFRSSPEVLAGATGAFAHPVFGDVEGELEYNEDDHGNGWLTVQQRPEIGDEIDFETSNGVELTGVIEDIDAAGDITVEDNNGLQHYLDVDEHTDEVSLTTNPDHPLYVGDHMDGVEDPWQDLEGEAWDKVEEVKPGDKVWLEDGPETVEAVDGAGLIQIDGEMIDADDIDQMIDTDAPEPPANRDNWDTALPDPFNPGDTVAYFDEDAGELVSGEVVEDYGDGSVEIDGYGPVEDPQIHGFADTGQPALPDGDDLDWVDTGQYVSVTWRDDYSDEILATEGYLVGYDEYSGAHTIYDPETGSRHEIRNPEEAVVTDYPEPPSTSSDIDIHTADPSEVADEIETMVPGITEPGTPDRDMIKIAMSEIAPRGTDEMYHALSEASAPVGSPDAPWKTDSGSREAGRWEEAFRRALDIDTPGRGGYEPSSESVKVAEAFHELSKRRWESHTPHEIYRGLSDKGGAGLFAHYLEDPEADEIDTSLLAINNFTEQRGTAESLGDSPVVIHRKGENVPSDWVASYHDDFVGGNNDSEAEISMRGDKFTVPPENIYFNRDTDVNLGSPPHEWDRNTALAVKNKIQRYNGDILDSMNPYEHPTPNQLENLVRIERVLNEKHDIPTHTLDTFQTAREELEAAGQSAEAVTYPELAAQGYGGTAETLPGEITQADDFVEGMEVTALDNGEEIPGEIVGVTDDGMVEIENVDTGFVATFSPYEVAEISYSPEQYGPPAQVNTNDLTTDDIDQLDEVYVWRGGDWETATVLDTDGDYELEVSLDSTGMTDYYETDAGRVVPTDMVNEPDSSPPEGSDGGFDPSDPSHVNELEPGIDVTAEIGDSTYTGPIAEMDGDDVWIDAEETTGNVPVEVDELTQADVDTSTPVNATTDLSPGDTIDHPGFTSTVEVTEVDEAGNVIVEDSSGFDYNLSLEQYEDITSDMVEPAEGSDSLSLEDYGLMENEGVTFDTGDGMTSGYVEYVNEDGSITVQTPELNDDTVTVDPEDINEPLDDPSEGSDDDEFQPEPGFDYEVGDSLMVSDGDAPPFSAEVTDIGPLGEVIVEDNPGVEYTLGDEIEPVEEEGDDEGIPSIDDTELVSGNPGYDQVDEGDLVSVDTQIYRVEDKPSNSTGYFELVGEDGETREVMTWEMDELVEPTEDAQTDAEGTGDTEDPSAPDDAPLSPEDAHDLSPAVGETIQIEFPGGPAEADVLDTSVDPNAPFEIEDEFGDQWLVWPDGELEPV